MFIQFFGFLIKVKYKQDSLLETNIPKILNEVKAKFDKILEF